jgi:hypothetical protein
MTTVQHPRQSSAQPSAVVWVTASRALVACLSAAGHLSTCRIERGREPVVSYMALVARAIGDRERVAILGPNAARLALEREYVAIYHRPERLIDVGRPARLEEAALVDRLYEVSTRGEAAAESGSAKVAPSTHAASPEHRP